VVNAGQPVRLSVQVAPNPSLHLGRPRIHYTPILRRGLHYRLGRTRLLAVLHRTPAPARWWSYSGVARIPTPAPRGRAAIITFAVGHGLRRQAPQLGLTVRPAPGS